MKAEPGHMLVKCEQIEKPPQPPLSIKVKVQKSEPGYIRVKLPKQQEDK